MTFISKSRFRNDGNDRESLENKSLPPLDPSDVDEAECKAEFRVKKQRLSHLVEMYAKAWRAYTCS